MGDRMPCVRDGQESLELVSELEPFMPSVA